ncbi:amino-acid permease inda1 [Aspergillus sclerotiicarbonarius CBS 121057]|uniref:Amino-acid permease inda1 n=1 Tax=Aspergillus sclerotiicarbonarius (strain CBS 121057 / IBT 28362) TaxID=1448318 RepID=A0A319DVA2_ASPSB|nr:amino-acid permease inda1 [Aspergillus sclerotiicarbonarius CBS 121057]
MDKISEKLPENETIPAEDDIELGSSQRALHRDLRSRHMQMIALGGAIGSGYFVSVGGALESGGPASVLICFLIIGIMIMCMIQALAELAVLYPINGSFFVYSCRFLDPSWGFAMGWDYAISWLTTLPFELTAAGLTLNFWNSNLNNGIWVTIFLVVICSIQYFGVRGFGEVESLLSVIKIVAILGFMILGIVIDCGGVPTDDRGYIGFEYWKNPGAFRNGFPGFCSVFVTAAFAYGGAEFIGLAAAETANPRQELPRAAKQVFGRIAFFYLVGLLILGIIVPSDSPNLLNASTSATKDSPFVLAIRLAGIPVLPSIFNAVITVSVFSVANSCTFGSTRTMQALALHGMAPQFLQYIDKQGRPLVCIAIQIAFGLIAYITEASSSEAIFDWLLALSGLSAFFTWGSICAAHLRFRRAWRIQGHSESEIPYRAVFGIWGSWVGLVLCVLCIIATFYTSVWPDGSLGTAYNFFLNFLAAPIVLFLYLFWKLWTRDRTWFVRSHEMDLTTGLHSIDAFPTEETHERTWMRGIVGLFSALF